MRVRHSAEQIGLLSTAYSLAAISGALGSHGLAEAFVRSLIEIDGQSGSPSFAQLESVFVAYAFHLLFENVFVFLVLVLQHFDALKHLQVAACALVGFQIRVSSALRRAVCLRLLSIKRFAFDWLILLEGLPMAPGWFPVTIVRVA